jgi:ribulose-phosphate 3-epimerase
MRKSVEIIPAILPKDFAELTDKVGLIKGFAKTVQIDICDGQFVPNATWPYKKRDDSFEKIIHEDEGMPEWKDLNYEFDLMVNRPEEVVTDWVSAGAMRVIVHAEARGNVSEAIALLRDRAEIGIALNIETPISIIEPYADQIQFVQCMGIDNIGFQHQQFDEKVIAKVREVKAKFPHLPVSVDGGVSLESAPKLIAAGANRLVVGSAIFNDENPIDAIQRFKRL